MTNRAVSVSQFNSYINKIIASEELLFNIAIYGEICDLSVSKSAVYFSIKDAGAILPCICFVEDCLKNLKNGMQATIVGSPQYYAKGGRLNFKVVKVYESGKGDAHLKFLELKEKLEKEGLFSAANKKTIKRFVKKIGVVTSLDGAVIKDIISVSGRRNPYVEIFVYNSAVQGVLAEKELCEGIRAVDMFGVDVIVVARGGGSGEDLSPFNSEAVARAVFEAKTPIVSAVGHETDISICDFVADLRAPTPSAAAELITVDIRKVMNALKGSINKAFVTCENKISGYKKCLNLYGGKMYSSVLNKAERKQNFLDVALNSFRALPDKLLKEKEMFIVKAEAEISRLNPYSILKQGYAKVLKDNRALLFENASPGDLVDIIMSGGRLSAEITKKGEEK